MFKPLSYHKLVKLFVGNVFNPLHFVLLGPGLLKHQLFLQFVLLGRTDLPLKNLVIQCKGFLSLGELILIDGCICAALIIHLNANGLSNLMLVRAFYILKDGWRWLIGPKMSRTRNLPHLNLLIKTLAIRTRLLFQLLTKESILIGVRGFSFKSILV
jgi:hypothetical protein